MDILLTIDALAALAGLALTAILYFFPRFGPASWTLSLFLIPGFLSSAALGLVSLVPGWTMDESVLLSFACLPLCAVGGCLSSYMIERENYVEQLRRKRLFLAMIAAPALVLTPLLYAFRPATGVLFAGPEDPVGLGHAGYYAALYLVLVSVISLGNVEQTLRSAQEHVLWEIKFLLLGIASTFGAIIYIASTILLYTPQYAFISIESLNIVPIIFLLSCALIFQSWRRSTGRSRVVVSQSAIYSTVTLLSVGGYLIASGLIARWASRWGNTGIPTEAVIFLVSLVAMSAVLLATAFRHRVRRWIRKNVFAGRYDYRQFWMDATERIRAIESPAVAASALVDLIQSALGSLDISVWLRVRNSDSMRMIIARGSISGHLPSEFSGLNYALDTLSEPVGVSELDERSKSEGRLEFLKDTKASILVPLVSSGRLVGLLTVGSDRSGKSFDWETREFLRVMAVHFATEFHKAELIETLVEAREAETFRTFSTFLLHDLKNFASTLSLLAKNATRHNGNPDFQLDAFQSVYDISEKMKRLCNNLRTFSNGLAANRVLDDVNQIVRSVAETFEINLGRHLDVDVQAIPPLAVDREEIMRVLQNLVLNAHEASPEGSPIKISTRWETRGIVISVEDKGKGIPKEFLEKELFQPFHTTKLDGLGIGLFQSKKIAEAHDGTIEAESSEGQGTTVRLILPAAGTTSPDHTTPQLRTLSSKA